MHLKYCTFIVHVYTVCIYINAPLWSLQFKTNCRSHFAFVEDCLDAHLVAAALKYLEIKDVEEASKFRQPLFEALPYEEQRQFIYSIARGILDRYIQLSDGNT